MSQNINIDKKNMYSLDEKGKRVRVNIDNLLSVATPESKEEKEIDADFKENGDLYKASMRIAMKVKRALRLLGWTQLRLAEELHMDPSVVSKTLSGKANMELKTIVKLEKVLNINIVDRQISQPAATALSSKTENPPLLNIFIPQALPAR